MMRTCFPVGWMIFLGLGVLPEALCRADEKDRSATVTISNVARRDTEGRVLDAHDGCLHKFGDRYFLYGTAYGKTDGFGKTNRYRCYSSPDLVTWKFEGDLLQHPPEGVYYRPYVAYNAQTRQYVLWWNWYPTLWNGQFGVATADRPQGPFSIRNGNVAVVRAQARRSWTVRG